MQKKLLWKIGGEAGFGIMSSGLIFAKNATRLGYHIYDYFEYPSLIRGGHNTYEVLVSDEPVHSTKMQIDLLVCLNRDAFELHKNRLHEKSIVLYDNEDFEIESGNFQKIILPLKKILKEEQAFLIMNNNIALGASLALMGWDLKILDDTIQASFEKKGEEVIAMNKRVAKRGFDLIHEIAPRLVSTEFPVRGALPKMVVTGNDSFAIGAMGADCRLYSAYPMTPSSTVLTTFAQEQEKVGIVARHAEDEISVINTALGASHAGVRAAVGTSGGGFALMVESISYAGIAEIPLVIFLSQRPGPATGLPTWTEQGELLFAVHAGHGEFPKIVLAPGDVREMYEMTAYAFDLADIYQTPVILLSDKLLSESHESMEEDQFISFFRSYNPNRGKLITTYDGDYLRYKVTADGISDRLIPGALGHFYQANSYEHTQDSHTTEDALERKAQVEKRNRKEQTYLSTHFKEPEFFGDAQAPMVFVSWGSTKGALLEAQKELATQGKSVGILHFSYLYPLDEKKVKACFKPDKKYVLIENNSTGQFGKLLRQETGILIEDKILKYDGRPIFFEEIVNYILKI